MGVPGLPSEEERVNKSLTKRVDKKVTHFQLGV